MLWLSGGWVHGGVCEQALPWQMGPNGILQGVVPPYGKPPAPDEEQNSRSSCLCLCHLRLQAMELQLPPEQQQQPLTLKVLRPPSPAQARGKKSELLFPIHRCPKRSCKPLLSYYSSLWWSRLTLCYICSL